MMRSYRKRKVRKYVVLGTIVFLAAFDIALLARYGWHITGL